MDIDSIEPIHWSCNETIHGEAKRVKPSLLAPHPWAITTARRPVSAGCGVLVIGPPPSPENDQRLYDLIKLDVREDWAILVKARGPFAGSIDFWASKGLRTVTADEPDGAFYDRLHGILTTYRTVVGCSLSSALVFAASIEREIVLLRDYFYEVYEPTRYEDEANLEAERGKLLANCLAGGDSKTKVAECRSLLGFHLLERRDDIRSDLLDAIHALERPFYLNPLNPIPYRVAEFLAMRLGKPGLLRHSPRDLLEFVRRRNISIMRINEIDVWLNGRRGANFQQFPIDFQEGITVPGYGPRGYGPQQNVGCRT
jgi:hypothetical protein